LTETFNNITALETDFNYRKYSSKDFNPENVEPYYDVEEILIKASNDGYVSEELINYLTNDNYNEVNSIVINSGVGQGKTVAVHQIAKQYLDDDYVVIIAAPFRSLVEKYVDHFVDEENISRESITSMESFSVNNTSSNEPSLLHHNKLHIITINLLLGNPGDNAFNQYYKKKIYLNRLIERCNQQNKKVVLFFDEIHAGVHNFKPNYIFHLFRFKNLIHKLFYVSATYSESSLIIIKCLASLTENKVKLLNCERERKRDNRAQLNLIMTPEHYSSKKTEVLKNHLYPIIKRTLDSDEQLNILCYSKSLAESLFYTDMKSEFNFNQIFKDEGVLDRVKCCVSEKNKKFDKKKQFEKGKINIGTTFKTGIDIEDGVYIIIMPTKYSINNDFISDGDFGVFTNGAISITQAIARMRGVGEIHLLIATPDKLINDDYSSFNVPFLQHSKIDLKDSGKVHDYNEQKTKLEYYYNEKREVINEEISQFENNACEGVNQRPIIRYPSIDEWILEKGEKFFYSQYLFYGHRISPFILWAALNDQFQNCTLNKISQVKPIKGFTTEDFEIELLKFLEDSYNKVDYGHDNSTLELMFFGTSDKLLLEEIIAQLLKYTFSLDGEIRNVLPPSIIKRIIIFIAYHKKDIRKYDKYSYLNDSVDSAREYKNEEESEIINLYQQLGDVKIEFCELFENKEFVYPKYDSIPNKTSLEPILERALIILNVIREKDKLIKNKDAFGIPKSQLSSISKVYNVLRNAFLDTETFNFNRRANYYGEPSSVKVHKLNGIKNTTRVNGLNLHYDYLEAYLNYDLFEEFV